MSIKKQRADKLKEFTDESEAIKKLLTEINKKMLIAKSNSELKFNNKAFIAKHTSQPVEKVLKSVKSKILKEEELAKEKYLIIAKKIENSKSYKSTTIKNVQKNNNEKTKKRMVIQDTNYKRLESENKERINTLTQFLIKQELNHNINKVNNIY